MSEDILKKVKLELVGLDGNAFSLMGAWKQAARRQGWTSEECKVVTDKCMSGDYSNLLCTLMNVSEEPENNEEDDDKADNYYCLDCHNYESECTCDD